jgi:glyoxylase-like metal-dependent hydrolase (beta-lactamase superfamily II)
VKPPRVDRALRDGDILDGLMVLHLPGHTPGHIGLQSGRVLFAGDTVSGGRRLRPAPGFLTWNEDLACRSIARLATLAVDLLLPGHGTPVDDGARRCAELVATKEG